MAETKLIRDHHLWTKDTIKNVSGNVTLDIVGDIALDAAGGDVNILQADLNIPVDKKVVFGNVGEYIVGDNTDLDIISTGGNIMFGNGTVDYTQIQNAGMNFYTSGVGHQVIKIASGTPSIRLVSLLDSADYAQIAGGVNGVLAITTVDGVGNEANISITADGFLSLASAAGEEILLAAGDGGYTKIRGDLDNTSASTNTGLYIDFDRVGAVTSGTDRNIGINLDVNATGAGTSGTPTVYTMGIDMDVVGDAAGSGTSTVTGLDLNVSGGDTNYAIITTGGNVGIGVSDPDMTLEVLSTSSQQKWSYDADSFLSMTVADSSHTTIATGESGNMILDAGGDITLDAGGGDVNVLQADLTIPVDKKVIFGNTGEYIVGDNTDLDIVSSNDLTFTIGGHVEFDGCAVGFDLETPTYDAIDTDVSFITGNKQLLTFGAGNITDLNLIFPETSGNFVLLLKQDGTGGRGVANYKAWDLVNSDAADGSATVKFAGGSNPDLTDDANHVDIISFFWDADNQIAYGVASLDFQF